MLQLIFGALTGEVGRNLAAAFKERSNAETERERIAANERIAYWDTVQQSQNQAVASLVRAAFALPFLVYMYKLILWDKLICGGGCSTDDLSDNLWMVFYIVLGFYFFKQARDLMR